jgi:hypothetical protein
MDTKLKILTQAEKHKFRFRSKVLTAVFTRKYTRYNEFYTTKTFPVENLKNEFIGDINNIIFNEGKHFYKQNLSVEFDFVLDNNGPKG